MMNVRLPILTLLLGAVAVIAAACISTASSPTPPPSTKYSTPELKYRLISNFGDIFYVDFDFYPVAREGRELKNAQEQFAAIRADVAEFSAILKHLNLADKAGYTREEVLAIYREHKKLARGVELTASGDVYRFVLRIGEGNGERIEGTITASGKIAVLKREPSFNTYPICLARGVLIDTPAGLIPVEQLQTGMSVWTLDGSGNRVAVLIEKTAITPVPAGLRIVKVSLSDGRSVIASAGHPAAGGRALGDYRVSEKIDGVEVIAVQSLVYEGAATYDILPAGTTGLYWANGILLMSTISR